MRALAICLRRPIATGAAYAALGLLGASALSDLPIALQPDVEMPSLSVGLTWAQASPNQMEGRITARVESEIQLLRGVSEISSVSGAGWARIDVEFERGSRMDRVEAFLRERLAALRDELPRDMQPPVIQRYVPEEMDRGDFMVLQAAGGMAPEALQETIEQSVVPRLLAVPGVAGADVYGGANRELAVALDRAAVERDQVRIADVGRSLGTVGAEQALGVVHRGGHAIPVVLRQPAAVAGEIDRAIVSDPGAPRVTVGDVARTSQGWEEPRRLSRLNGRPSVQITLDREQGANVLRVASAVRRELAALRGRLPQGVSIAPIFDQSEQIQDELAVLGRRSGLSALLILLVMVVAERRVRAPVVILGSVLLATVVTLMLLRAAGLGIDLITLSGLALALGMAVDNSIVLLENVRLRVKGHALGTPRRVLWTLAASREVSFPLLAATMSTAVVMIPFLYMSGELRAWYMPFVLAVCLSLLASLAVAFTLTPLLARWAQGGRVDAARRTRIPPRLARACSAAHDRWLRGTIRRAPLTAAIAGLLLGASVWVFATQVSRGSIFAGGASDTALVMTVSLPPGSEIEQTDALLSGFERLALEHPFYQRRWLEQVETMMGQTRGRVIVRFAPAVAKSSAPQILREQMTMHAATISGAEVGVFGSGPGYSSGGSQVSPSYQLQLRGPDFLRLSQLADDLAGRLQRNARITNVSASGSGWITREATELAVVPDRLEMARLGVSMRELVERIQPAIASELSAQQIRTPDGEVIGRVRFAGEKALTPLELTRTLGRSSVTGTPYTLGDLVRVEERSVQGEIHRRDQEYERAINFEYRGPRRVGDRFVRALVANTQLPPGYSLRDGLGIFLTSEDERAIHLALTLSLALVYIVAAALFESLLLPFVALLAVPLSFIGIVLAFWITGETFDRTAYVGLILLTGITINSALLLVHRAGALVRRGLTAGEAARRAARERMRPILMTTATSVAGLLPLVAESDAVASTTWRSLSLASVGGLLASACFTLSVVPALFALFARARRTNAAGHPLPDSTLDNPGGPLMQRRTLPTGAAAWLLCTATAAAVTAATVALPAAAALAAANTDEPVQLHQIEPLGKGNYALTPSLSLGGPNAPDAAQFYERMGPIEVDADGAGNIYVLDNGNHRVQVFDAKGNPLRAMGAEGGGPGEFKIPGQLCVSKTGMAAVFDMGQQRITLFGQDGKLVRDQIIPGMVKDMALTADGSLVLAYGLGSGTEMEAFDAQGKSLWKIEHAEQPRGARFVQMEIDGMTVGSRLVAAAGGTVYQASGEEYWIRKLDAAGRPRAVLSRPFERLKMPEMPRRDPDDEGEGGGQAVVIVRREGGGGAGGGTSEATAHTGAEAQQQIQLSAEDVARMMPKNRPDIRALLAWPDGRVWAVTAQDEGDRMVVDEWTADGKYAKRFPIPGNYARLRVGADGRLYGVSHDDEDFPIVHRLEVAGS